MVQQPSATAANGAVFAQQPTVQVQDASGNPVVGTNSVTATILTGGGTLGGTATVSTGGTAVATFAGLSITGLVGSRTLQFASGALASTTSTAINISAGAATQLVMVQQPSATAANGAVFPQQPTVQVQDASGNPVTGSTSVTASILTGGGALGGTATVSTGGTAVATFAGLSITGVVGSRTLQFASGTLTAATSTAINITAGAATQLVLLQQPSASAANGAVFAQQPTVQVQDASGNPVAGTNLVTATILTGGGALGGTATVSTGGTAVATFAGLSITGPVGSRTLQFASGALAAATSTAINITVGAPTQMAISTGNAQSATAGTAVAIAPAVLVRDVSNNPVSGVLVTFAAVTGGGSALPGAAVATNASGIATAASWTLGPLEGPNTLTATAAPGGITPNPVTFTATGVPGPATGVAITTAPTAGQSGIPFTTQPVIRLVDINGNTVGTNGTLVTATLATGTGTLAGATATTVAGVATFASLAVTGLAGNYSLRFDAPSLTGVTGATFPIAAGTPVALAFLVPPVTTAAGASIPSPQVEVRDGAGNRVTTATTAITVGIGSNPGGSTLTGTATQSAVAGVATFPALSLNRTGTGYTLTATGGALPTATSSAFNITPGAPASVAFAGQPSAVTAGASIAPAVTVEIRDGNGNVVTTSTASVTVAIGTNPSVTGVLSGTTTLNAVAGVATFSNLSINLSGVGYTLNANSGALVGPASSAFTVTPGLVSGVSITSAPTAGTNGVALTPAAVARLVDVLGNTVPTTGTTVTAALNSGSGSLGGTTNATTSNGVATFSNLVLTGTAGPFTLSFGSSGLTSATSSTITLATGAANTIAPNSALTQGGTAGQPVAAPPSVRVTDTGGNPVSGVPVTFAVAGGGGSLGGSLVVATNGSGIATVASWTLGATVGVNSVTASAGVPSGSPVTFTATSVAGAANSIASNSLTSQSTIVNTAVGAPPSVIVRDAGLNPVSGLPVTFTVTLGGGAIVGGAATTNASGVATLTSWTLGTLIGANTVTATATVPTGSPVTFNATGTPAAAAAVAFDTQPSGATLGATITPPVTVRIVDGFGNLTASTATVNLALGTNPGGATLGGTTSRTAVAGVATFNDLSLNAAGAGYTLTAASGVLSGATSAGFTIGAATSTTAIASDLPDPSLVGQVVGVNFTVSGAGVSPTGNVTVSDGAGTNCVGTVLTGTCNLTFTTAGAKTITATYAGDGNYSGSVSLGAAHSVTAAASTTTITGDSPDPSVVGQFYTVTFTVTGPGVAPTGNVTVADGTGGSCVATVAAGNCALASTTIGAKTLTASYAGDGNYLPGVSAGAPHGVDQAATTTSITSFSPPTATADTLTVVTINWSVPVTAPGAGTPTGSVVVTTDGAETCSAAVAAGSCTLTFATSGTRSVTVAYQGDTQFLPSATAPTPYVVNP